MSSFEIYLFDGLEWQYAYIDYISTDEQYLEVLFRSHQGVDDLMYGLFSEYGKPDKVWHKGVWYDARQSQLPENS